VAARLIVAGGVGAALPIAAPSLTISVQLIGEDFMIARSGIFQFGLMLATTLSIAVFSAFAISTAAHAYTPEEEQACSGDAMRLCSAYIPDVDRITACMIQLRDQLSPGCRVFFRAAPEPLPVAATKPMVIKPHKPGKASKAKKPHKTG
jgi:hypothetical protein